MENKRIITKKNIGSLVFGILLLTGGVVILFIDDHEKGYSLDVFIIGTGISTIFQSLKERLKLKYDAKLIDIFSTFILVSWAIAVVLLLLNKFRII
ncbi:hypothetical protein ACFLR7_04120 [Acidobacteriota bacterium]